MKKRQHYTGLSLAAIMITAACSPAEDVPPPVSTIFGERWNSGLEANEPPLQLQRFDENTLVIRQSLKTNFEAPFMYLLFGDDKALLIDTGAGNIDLRSFVDRQIEEHLRTTGKDTISLVVMHSHAHGDHVAGDDQFADRPDTQVIGHTPKEIATFFSINNWPEGYQPFDLGGRTVDIIPTPGHHDSHVMVFDDQTGILFSGDTIYPGRLYFRCSGIGMFKNSFDKLISYTATRNITWVMGAHIELSATPGESYGRDDLKRSNERLIELQPSVITDIRAAAGKMLQKPRVEPYEDFILFPIPANPQGKTPPDWCEAS